MTAEQKETSKLPAGKSCIVQIITCMIQIIIGVIVFYLIFVGVMVLFLHWHTTDSGEHTPVPTNYPNDATDYSFYKNVVVRYCEFSVPEESFLKYSKGEKWDVADIEKENAFYPKVTDTDSYEVKKPLIIKRYIYFKPEHHECGYKECKVDPTFLTDKSCWHVVSNGYWYETNNGAGRGITVLYDKENVHCYIEYRLR